MGSRRDFLATIAAQALVERGAAAAAQAQTRKPNIIVIVADDLGYGDLGCFGGADMQTPNLDRLAASGVQFKNWRANSPVCSPSRASTLTGKYPQHAGIPEILTSRPSFDVPGLHADEITIAKQLKSAGYRTAAVGKWHLGSARHSRPQQQGFDDFFGFYSGWIDYYSHRYYTLGGQPIYHDLWRGDEEVWRDGTYQTELFAQEARSFVERQNPANPFFLYLAFGAPHYPMMAPLRHVNRFSAGMDRDRRLHAATVSALDEGIGAVLDTLEKKGLRQDTIVFFQSDNGATSEVRADHAARPYRGGSNGPFHAFKGSLYDGGMHVAAMMSWPARIRAGQVSTAALAGMDLAPTLYSWAGTSSESSIDGISFAEHVTDNAGIQKRTLLWEYAGQTAALQGSWKLVANVREGLGLDPSAGRKLFQLANDPGEKTDVLASNETTADGLTKEIHQWQQNGYRAAFGVKP